MALRIHFTADDLARTVVSPRPDPMWELVNSLHILQSRRPVPGYAPWLRHARARLGARDHRATLRMLTALVPPRGCFPDFLTPADTGGFGAALDSIAATAPDRLRADLAAAFAGRTPPSWAGRVAAGDRQAGRELLRALTAYHDDLLAPYWPVVKETIHGERSRVGRDVLDGGVEGLLRGLEPVGRWRQPVLTCTYPIDRDLRLEGRGLTLIPSYFCTRAPVTFIDGGLPPVLVYPAAHHRPTAPHAGLTSLLGRTRAAILCALDQPCSTTELALHAGVSIGSASRHAATLRDAGLITSTRQRSAVLHARTRLGRDLARGRRVHTDGRGLRPHPPPD